MKIFKISNNNLEYQQQLLLSFLKKFYKDMGTNHSNISIMSFLQKIDPFPHIEIANEEIIEETTNIIKEILSKSIENGAIVFEHMPQFIKNSGKFEEIKDFVKNMWLEIIPKVGLAVLSHSLKICPDVILYNQEVLGAIREVIKTNKNATVDIFWDMLPEKVQAALGQEALNQCWINEIEEKPSSYIKCPKTVKSQIKEQVKKKVKKFIVQKYISGIFKIYELKNPNIIFRKLIDEFADDDMIINHIQEQILEA